MEKETRLYVGCSLTQAPEEFKDAVRDFKGSLRESGYDVMEFIGLEGGTEADVYNWDIGECVRKCDMLVGVCDYPSIGLGWELAEATKLGKMVLAVVHEEVRPTRLLLGAAAVEPNVHLARYTHLPDVLPIVDELAAEYTESSKRRGFQHDTRTTGPATA